MKNTLPAKPFYFIRHGQSVWNELNQFAGGHTDTPLTELGREKAREAKAVFDKLSPTPSHIIHSPLSRAKDTAFILNSNRDVPMIEEDNLREVFAGEWAGLPNEVAKEKWSNGETPKDGENLDMFADRICAVFTRILSHSGYKMPFISAHGRIINAFDTIYGIKPRSLQVKNCQILKFTPNSSNNRRYSWDVYIQTLENGQIHEELAAWSQV